MSTRAHRRPDHPVRYAVVGLGHIVQTAVLPVFERIENSELTALVSGNVDKRAQLGDAYDVEHRVSYEEYSDFLREGLVDAVYIGLPNHLHCQYTVEAAAAGVHVLCEKPMAVTVAECRRMIEACEQNEVELMIAYRLHFEAANLEAIEFARSGQLGDLRYFEASFSQDVEEGDIRLSPIAKGGGSVYDLGIYCINAARYLFRAEPFEAMAFSESSEDARFDECDEMTSAILRFPGHRLASFTTSFGATSTDSFRLVGTDGELHMEPAFEYAGHLGYEVRANGGSQSRTFPKRDQFGPELIYFSDCIIGGEPPEPDGREGMADVRIIEAIYEASRRDRPVRFEAIEGHRRPDVSQEITCAGIEEPKTVDVSSPERES